MHIKFDIKFEKYNENTWLQVLGKHCTRKRKYYINRTAFLTSATPCIIPDVKLFYQHAMAHVDKAVLKNIGNDMEPHCGSVAIFLNENNDS